MPIRLEFKDRKVDKAFVEAMQAAFEAAGITQQQAEHIAGAWQQHTDRWLEADSSRQAAAAETALAGVKSRWGSQFDGNVAAGKKAAAALGLDRAALNALDRSIGLASTMDLLARIGTKVVSDATTGGTKITITDPEAARAQISRLAGDKTFQDTMRDLKNPTARQDALQRWQDLHAAAYPTAEPSSPEPPATPPSGPTDDSRAAARVKIDAHLADAGFMGSLRDTSHANHAANRATFDQLQTEAGDVQ